MGVASFPTHGMWDRLSVVWLLDLGPVNAAFDAVILGAPHGGSYGSINRLGTCITCVLEPVWDGHNPSAHSVIQLLHQDALQLCWLQFCKHALMRTEFWTRLINIFFIHLGFTWIFFFFFRIDVYSNYIMVLTSSCKHSAFITNTFATKSWLYGSFIWYKENLCTEIFVRIICKY